MSDTSKAERAYVEMERKLALCREIRALGVVQWLSGIELATRGISLPAASAIRFGESLQFVPVEQLERALEILKREAA